MRALENAPMESLYILRVSSALSAPVQGFIFKDAPLIHLPSLLFLNHSFDSSKELGEGGFGTVYKGKRNYPEVGFLSLPTCY